MHVTTLPWHQAGGGLRNKSEAEAMRDYAVLWSSRTVAPDRQVCQVLLMAQHMVEQKLCDRYRH